MLASAINDTPDTELPAAADHIRAAQEFAARTGDTDLFMTAFGPLDVEFHSHTVELEADEPTSQRSKATR
ncbi:hypothetical protein [Nocardia sp. CA-120079]|uniref:hypothetical protein n=1 Tax=Nocardia sp. CA-120079 TaxID=3239974 RepID=UPI003D95D18C